MIRLHFFFAPLFVFAVTLCLISPASPTPAQEARTTQERLLTGQEFDRLTRGKTLHYQFNGRAFGSEVYGPNRQATWRDIGGVCKSGSWSSSGHKICFRYFNASDEECWQIVQKPQGIFARKPGADPLLDIEVVSISRKPLRCKGNALNS